MQTTRSTVSYYTVLVFAVGLALLAIVSASTAGASPIIGQERSLAAGHLILSESTPESATPTAPSSPTPPGQANLGQVAYVKDGDIWLQAVPDGKAQPLTNTGTNSEPRWSPSGKWIAHRSKDQLQIVGVPGAEARTLSTGDKVDCFAWAPNEDRLTYVTAKGELWSVGVNGSTPVKLMPQDNSAQTQGRVTDFAWNPDGTWIACDLTKVLVEAKDGKPPVRAASIWRVPVAGGDALKVYDAGSPAEDGVILAGWAPGAQEIMFWLDPLFSASLLADGVPLHTISLEGGEPITLTQPMLLHPDFWSDSPDGKILAITEGQGRETWTNKQIAILEMPGGKSIATTDKAAASTSPSWAPDSQRIAYVTAPDPTPTGSGTSEQPSVQFAERRIALLNLDGSGYRQLTRDPEYRDERPLWSADGSSILFARLDARSQASLWLVSLEDDNPRCVIDELGPVPNPSSYTGYIDWDSIFDWSRGD